MSTARIPSPSSLCLLGSFVAAVGCGGDDDSVVADSSVRGCVQDLSLDPASAEPLLADEEQMGFVCPAIDEDWFTFDVSAAEPLTRVELTIDNARSPVDATYAISPQDTPAMAVATPDGGSVAPGADFDDTHCLGAGSYNIVVRDQGADAQDIRNPYLLRISNRPEPDSSEPNNAADAATPLAMGAPVSGFISCIGDEDYYTFDVGARDAVRIALEAAELGYEPELTVFEANGQTVISQGNPRGAFDATAIGFERQLDAGTYTLRIADDDGTGANPDVAYVLTIGLFEDPDTNEPNNGPLEATALGSLTCDAGWSNYLMNGAGAIVTAADTDWFEVSLAGCVGGIVEAEAEIDTSGLTDEEAWQLQQQLQMSVTLVRDAPDSPCDEDADCNVLPQTCEENIDCAGLLEACQREGRCAGARLCLPGSRCGANQTFRAYQQEPIPSPITGPPPPNRAVAAAPILASGNLWVRIADFQSNGGDLRARYTVRVRVRSEPDAFEPDNLYTSNPFEIEGDGGSSYTIRDCTAGDCCGPGTFTTGHIGYEGDRDFFRGSHPCPGQNCVLRLHYQVDGGEVSPLLRLSTSAGRWYETALPPGTTGTIGDLGGPTGAGQCIVANREHDMSPFDVTLFHYDEEVPEETNWDADQAVRFCLEIVSNACMAPCIPMGDDCNQR